SATGSLGPLPSRPTIPAPDTPAQRLTPDSNGPAAPAAGPPRAALPAQRKQARRDLSPIPPGPAAPPPLAPPAATGLRTPSLPLGCRRRVESYSLDRAGQPLPAQRPPRRLALPAQAVDPQPVPRRLEPVLLRHLLVHPH